MAIYGHIYGINMATNLNKGPYKVAPQKPKSDLGTITEGSGSKITSVK